MTNNVTFTQWMELSKATVESDLDKYLPSGHTDLEKLHEAMRYAVLGGGKRIRPLLVYAAGEVSGALPDALRRAAAALEMVHIYSLVHDDMPCMDNDVVRHGKPTVHVAYDEPTALLVGNALQSQAFITLAVASSPRLPPAQHVELLAQLAKATGSLGMCGGQAIDLESVGIKLNIAQLEKMHQLKTGALIQAAVALGTICGREFSKTEMASLNSYAVAMGLAFQVVDDILDMTSDSITLGKTAGKDAACDKPTYVSILGLRAAEELADKLYSDAMLALSIFGSEAQRLRDLASFIIMRKV